LHFVRIIWNTSDSLICWCGGDALSVFIDPIVV
jgi:hypothetical protein